MWKFGGLILVLCLLAGCNPAPKPASDVDRSSSPDVEQATASDPSVQTRTISVLAWNVQSGGNGPEIIARQLGEFDGYDIVCLQEVAEENFDRYNAAFGPKFQSDDRKTDPPDAYSVARWLTESDERGFLDPYFYPPLTDKERKVADLEGWILGIM